MGSVHAPNVFFSSCNVNRQSLFEFQFAYFTGCNAPHFTKATKAENAVSLVYWQKWFNSKVMRLATVVGIEFIEIFEKGLKRRSKLKFNYPFV